jgi:hypothetical protein
VADLFVLRSIGRASASLPLRQQLCIPRRRLHAAIVLFVFCAVRGKKSSEGAAGGALRA